MKNVSIRIFISYSIFFLIHSSALAQSKFNVYYLSIGSVYYKNNPQLANFYWSNIKEAAASASIMASCFSKYGDAKGLTIISNESEPFSKDVLQQALNKIWDMMLNDKPANPLLIIYYCGHGFSENLANSQFLLSGDCSSMRPQENFETLRKKNIFVPEIGEMLMALSIKTFGQLNIPRYLFLLDCCRGQKQDDALDMQKVKTHWGDVSPGVKVIFDKSSEMLVRSYKQSEKLFPGAIVYATSERKEAEILKFPNIGFSLPSSRQASGVGPICRRNLLLLDKKMKESQNDIDLQSFVEELQKQSLDPGNDAPVSPYTPDRIDNSLFLTAPLQQDAAFSLPGTSALRFHPAIRLSNENPD